MPPASGAIRFPLRQFNATGQPSHGRTCRQSTARSLGPGPAPRKPHFLLFVQSDVVAIPAPGASRLGYTRRTNRPTGGPIARTLPRTPTLKTERSSESSGSPRLVIRVAARDIGTKRQNTPERAARAREWRNSGIPPGQIPNNMQAFELIAARGCRGNCRLTLAKRNNTSPPHATAPSCQFVSLKPINSQRPINSRANRCVDLTACRGDSPSAVAPRRRRAS